MKRTARSAPIPKKASTATTIALEMATANDNLFDLQEVGDNETRWDALVDACEAESRKRDPTDLPVTGTRSAAARDFYAALPKPLQQQYRAIESWDSILLNIYSIAGYRLGLAVGRGGVR